MTSIITHEDNESAASAGTVVRYIGPRGPHHGVYTIAGPCRCSATHPEKCATRYRITKPSGRGLCHVPAEHLLPGDGGDLR